MLAAAKVKRYVAKLEGADGEEEEEVDSDDEEDEALVALRQEYEDCMSGLDNGRGDLPKAKLQAILLPKRNWTPTPTQPALPPRPDVSTQATCSCL